MLYCDNENALIPVAIPTTSDFDAATIDHNTVTFEGASEVHVNNKSGEALRHEEDVDDDGDLDLVFHFRVIDTQFTCSSNEATLTGETFSGQGVIGIDLVNMIHSLDKS